MEDALGSVKYLSLFLCNAYSSIRLPLPVQISGSVFVFSSFGILHLAWPPWTEQL